MNKITNLQKSILFMITTLLLILISVFCITGTVISQTDIGASEMENFYREQEKLLLGETKDRLEELGYANSGVTLTRVVDDAGNREYTFTIHHKKIDKLSGEEQSALADKLVCDTSALENCSFYHEFLRYE